jgi:hypothetical protein
LIARNSGISGRPAASPARLARWLVLSAVVWMLTQAGSVCRVSAQSEDGADINREYAIKAAYLYQFGRYVQWPSPAFAGDRAPLVIGVLGTDAFGGILDEIARTKQIDGRVIVVRRFATMAEYTPCHILFINATARAEDKEAAIRKLQGVPTLLVGEEPGFAEHGGMVNFFQDENKIRFEINTEIARQARLKISSKLLSLAKIVGHY